MEKTVRINISHVLLFDTVVIGGGVAGSAAAISSARCGAKTLLVEADGALGGQAGIGLVTPLSSVRTPAGVSFGGLIDEILESTRELTKKYVSDGYMHQWQVTAPSMMRYALLKMATDAGVTLLFHSMLSEVLVEKDRISAVILSTKSGFVKVVAKNFIDASGDGDIIALSGDSYVTGSERGIFDQLIAADLDRNHTDLEKNVPYDKESQLQPSSLFFIMRGVDLERAMELNNKKITFGDLGITRERFDAWDFSGTLGFTVTDGRVPMPQNRVLVSPGRHPDEAVINMSRVTDVNGADAFSLSRGEVDAQLQLIAIVDFLKTFIPGFEHSYLTEVSSRLGIRESRRLVGRYKLSGLEVIRGARYADTVAKGYYLIDIHDPSGKFGAIGGEIKTDHFEIPFRALCSSKYKNLLAAGRCISADHVAHSATRIQGACILTGEAAGTAAALVKDTDIGACDVSIAELRKKLSEDGVNLE